MLSAQRPAAGHLDGDLAPAAMAPREEEDTSGSGLLSFLDRTEHLAEDRLFRQHLGELFDQGP